MYLCVIVLFSFRFFCLLAFILLLTLLLFGDQNYKQGQIYPSGIGSNQKQSKQRVDLSYVHQVDVNRGTGKRDGPHFSIMYYIYYY